MVPGSGNGRRLDSRSSRSSHDSPRLLIPEKKHSMDNKRFSKATPPPSPQDIEGSRRSSKSQRSRLQLYSHSETNRKGWKGSSWLASGRMADAEILLAGRRLPAPGPIREWWLRVLNVGDVHGLWTAQPHPSLLTILSTSSTIRGRISPALPSIM